MLVEVMTELQPFLLIYFITIIAFADAFSTLSTSQVANYVNQHYDQTLNGNQTIEALQEEAQQAVGIVDNYFQAVLYTYTLTLGEFELENYYSFLCYFYFLSCAALNLIVMLNLLIAVISETHSRVTDKQD